MSDQSNNQNNTPPSTPADPSVPAGTTLPTTPGSKQVNTGPPTPKGSSKIRGNITKDLLEKEYVTAEKKAADLSNAIFHTMKGQPFLGSILQCLNIAYVHTIPTAGVMFNNDLKRWDMLINPHFFCTKLNNEQRIAVLVHEMYHITHKHPLRVPFIKISPRKRMLMNIAADMAINQFIPNLPNGCQSCPPPLAGKPCTNPLCPGRCIDLKDYNDTDDKGNKVPWKEKQSMEFYYEKLIQLLDDPEDDDDGDGDGDGESGDGKGKGKGKAGGKGNAGGGTSSKQLPDTLDEHIWDGSAEEKDMLDATEDLVKRAMVKQRLSYDDLPGHIKELLDDIKMRRAELNYRALINSAIKRHASGHERKHTWTRVSRRFGNKAPGTKVGDLPKLQMFIDTSGSISIEEANEFLEIVDNFLKAGSRKCRLNMFHTANYYSEEYKLGMRLDRGMIQSGGTDLTESMKEIHKRKPDLAIFLTDGCYGDVRVEEWMRPAEHFPQCLFIISKGGTVDHPLKRLGETIKIPNGA